MWNARFEVWGTTAGSLPIGILPSFENCAGECFWGRALADTFSQETALNLRSQNNQHHPERSAMTEDLPSPQFVQMDRPDDHERRTQATIVASEAKFRGLIEGIEDIPCTIDLEGRLTYMGPQMGRYGFRPEDMVGRPFSEFIHEEDRERLFEAFQELLATEREFREEFRVVTPGSGIVWFEDSPRINRDESGMPCELFVILRDTSERRMMEERLRNAKEAAEAASRAKSDFLANMSHEIRTPMTAILGYSDLLFEEELSDGLTPERATAWESIRRNGDHLLELINSLLELSQIESGEVQLEPKECRPLDIILDVITSFKAGAFQKNLAFKLETEGRIPGSAYVDPVRLRQILFNLIGNAVKFTDHGEIRVVVRQVQVDERLQLQFDVIDTGIGIPEEQVALLFGRFTQLDSGASRRFGGTGLGLAISQRLALLLGGGIEVESRVGEGSRFRLTVDAPAVPKAGVFGQETAQRHASAPRQKTGEATLSGTQILLVEDGPDNQRLLSFVLTRAGATVTVAENGELALEQVFESGDDVGGFDVILMDMQMPVMDGYAATRELRRRGCQVPIIAVTAHAITGDRQKCLDVGCDEYLSKPLDYRVLLEVIAGFLSRKEPSEVASCGAAGNSL